MNMIERETFMNLPTEEVARLVREAGPQVCVFPINGTRRWFMLEHGNDQLTRENPVQAYLDITGKEHIRLYALCFEHGLDSLLTPVFGSELLTRGDEYMQKTGADGMARLATHPDFVSFYRDYRVRIHFYGDYHEQLAGTPLAYLSDLFDQITKATAQNDRYRLFYGVFANDATETVARLSVLHYQKTANVPKRSELIEQYYGEYVDPASLFIGFDKFSVFDYPLLASGQEDLYFTSAPSLYLSDRQLRAILYDHIFLRQAEEANYSEMSKGDFKSMQDFYEKNRGNTFGVGELSGGVWYPTTSMQD